MTTILTITMTQSSSTQDMSAQMISYNALQNAQKPSFGESLAASDGPQR